MNVTPNVIYGHGEYSVNVQRETPKFDGGVDIKKYTAVLSNGDDVILEMSTAGCAAPSIPDNITIEDVVSTEEGAEIHFHCNKGYSLSNGNTSKCLNSLWSPDPQDQRCILPIPSGDFSLFTST